MFYSGDSLRFNWLIYFPHGLALTAESQDEFLKRSETTHQQVFLTVQKNGFLFFFFFLVKAN